jgi:hypothetical protein
MATITGMTADAMDAIRDGHIVTADFDSAGHLILTKFDGTQIDAGTVTGASTTLAGIAELATSAETVTGTDAVRVVTPAGLSSVRLISLLAETALPSSYPLGISEMYLTTGSGWSINNGFGYLLTNCTASNRAAQVLYSNAGGTQIPRVWVRSYHDVNGGGGWAAWREESLLSTLTAASFTQATAMASYPNGFSRLYYTTANSTSWDFTGLAGEVHTYFDSITNFARQTFVQHVSGSANKPLVWIRTSDNVTGWSSWTVMSEPGAWTTWTPTWTTSSGSATPAYGNAVLDCRASKSGRRVECKFEITFGTSTNFGTSPTTGDNWLFSLPYTAARAGDQIGFIELHGTGNSTIAMGRARTNTTGNLILGVTSCYVSGVAPTNTGDVDSLTPFTWASTHSIKGSFTYESAA